MMMQRFESSSGEQHSSCEEKEDSETEEHKEEAVVEVEMLSAVNMKDNVSLCSYIVAPNTNVHAFTSTYGLVTATSDASPCVPANTMNVVSVAIQ
jgi:hypothetical protein